VERDQFEELLLGLELTGMPFLAALKPSAGYEPIKLPLPEGRVKKKKKQKKTFQPSSPWCKVVRSCF